MKYKQPILGYRDKAVSLFNKKAKGLRKYVGIALIVYAVLPLMSFWAIFPGLFLLSGISFNTQLKSIRNELVIRWRLR